MSGMISSRHDGASIAELSGTYLGIAAKWVMRIFSVVLITQNLKGRQYIHDAILFLIQNENNDESVIQYLTRIHKKSSSTITNGIQNAIIHGWRVSAIEDLEKYYTAKINYQTGLPTPMELIYYYVSKIKRMI